MFESCWAHHSDVSNALSGFSLVQLLSGGEHRHQGSYPFRAGLRPLGRMNTPLYGVRVRAIQGLIERGSFLVGPPPSTIRFSRAAA
jgi:hypothetical protein